MDLIALCGDREERIAVVRDGEIWEVRLGDRTYRVDAADAGGSARSFLVEGRQYEVTIEVLNGNGTGRSYVVSSAAGLETVEVLDPLTHLAEKAHAGTGAGGRRTVKAYMPGRVVTLLAEEGAAVEAGQGVLVLEAMKMENEIQAEGAGSIAAMHVEPGQAVDAGDPLFDLETG